MSSNVLKRLSTFAQWPMPSDACSGISSFPFKAAEAHFQRTADCLKDGVMCQSCGVHFCDWSTVSPSTECKLYMSPAAVHRVISPKCPALNPSDSDVVDLEEERMIDWNMLLESPFAKYVPNHLHTNYATPERSQHPTTSEREARARRVLFPESHENQEDQDNLGDPSAQNQNADTSDSTPQPSVLDQKPIKHPYKPKTGNYDHLFASQRLQTFPQPITCAKYQTWAEEGFIFRREQQDVMCVYCGTVLVLNGHQPGAVHRKVCPSCPLVMGFDVGNITQQEEKWIRLVYYKQQAAQKPKVSDFEMGMKYVQYQKEEDRLGSFQGWPKMCAKIFPPAVMASAGFFYSGCSDKVKCYSCGVELYDWSEEADVWVTHAAVSPTCQHAINVKGQDFIAQAAQTQILAEVKYPKDSTAGGICSSNGVVEEEVGSSTLDIAAVKAALACGYTLPQIQHAIVKFFCQTSRFPNEAILKASLRAADENHIIICKQQQVVLEQQQVVLEQQQVVLEKDTQLQHKDTQLQHKDTQLQHKDTQLQQQGAQLQQSYTQLDAMKQEKEQTVQTLQQQLDSTVTHLNEQLSEKEEQLIEKVEQLNEKEDQLIEKEEQLNVKEEQLRWQDQQIQSLMQQVQQLRADHHHRPQPAAGPQGDAGAVNNARAGHIEEARHSLVCKICMMDKPRMIFLPCGHLFSCAECTSRLPDRRCPVCRQDISKVLPAFVA